MAIIFFNPYCKKYTEKALAIRVLFLFESNSILQFHSKITRTLALERLNYFIELIIDKKMKALTLEEEEKYWQEFSEVIRKIILSESAIEVDPDFNANCETCWEVIYRDEMLAFFAMEKAQDYVALLNILIRYFQNQSDRVELLNTLLNEVLKHTS